MNGMRYIELGRQRGVELMNVTTIPHNALTVCNVEVSGDFVYTHFAAHGAALVSADVGEMLGTVVYALRGVTQNL